MMSRNWQYMKLVDFVKLQRGHDLPEHERKSGQVPVMGSFGITGYHNVAKVKGPGVTIGRSGASIGVVCYTPDDYWPLNTALYVTDFQGNDERFAYYFLNTLNLTNYNSGSAQPSLNRNYIYPMLIKIPPLPEQQAIATVLTDVDVLIASLGRLIAKKRDIKQATMQQLFTGKRRLPGFSGEWKVKKLGEIFQFLNTANNSRSDLSENGDIKYIHYGDIHMKWRSFLDCSSDELPLIQRDKVRNVPFLEDGDLVMADVSEDYDGVGISVEVKNATSRKVVAGLHTFLLRGDKEVLADGFKGYLQYIPAVKDSLKKAATGISVYGISKNNVRNISICLPDITEQRAIAAILSDIDAEIAALEQKRDKTRALKQGMMQELLTGKTRLI